METFAPGSNCAGFSGVPWAVRSCLGPLSRIPVGPGDRRNAYSPFFRDHHFKTPGPRRDRPADQRDMPRHHRSDGPQAIPAGAGTMDLFIDVYGAGGNRPQDPAAW